MMISIIAAMTKGEKVIGKDGQLPWRISEDLKNFKLLTENKVVIMGRKTYFSIPKKFRPLPNRKNIVLSKSMSKEQMQNEIGVDFCSSVDEALVKAKSYEKDIFIIGGGQIYSLMEQYADTMQLSFIKKEYEGNTFFPKINWDKWQRVSTKDFEEFDFVTFKRV